MRAKSVCACLAALPLAEERSHRKHIRAGIAAGVPGAYGNLPKAESAGAGRVLFLVLWHALFFFFIKKRKKKKKGK